MSKTITFIPSNHKFILEGNNSILDAALQSGFSPDYGCNSGNCGKCKARLLSGNIRKIKHYDYIYNQTEKNNGYFLQCAYTAESDLLLEANEATSSKDIPLQNITVKLKKVECVNEYLAVVSLQTPRSNTLRFLAGQSIELKNKTTVLGKFYIASCPCDDRNLQLHINTACDDNKLHFDQHFRHAKELQLTGPYGDFTLDEETVQSCFFITSAHGFAPVKSLIEHAIALDYAGPLRLFRFDREGEKPYLDNLCRSWADAFEDFEYVSTRHLSTTALLDKLLAQISLVENPACYLACGPEQTIAIEKQLQLLNQNVQIYSAEIINCA